MNIKTKIVMTAVIGIGAGFAAGFFTGSAITKKKKDEEIGNMFIDFDKKITEIYKQHEKKEEQNIVNVTQDENVTDVTEKQDRFYTIGPNEFGEDDRTQQVLYLYENGIITSMDNTVISQPETIIGKGMLSRMGEYEPDALYVRDSKLNIDYQVLLQFEPYKKE